ncbi:MAG: ParB N-terminal domain-containing protein, partial [Oscillospiraceae bacterium]|nr:ParB N-terminal domain-containing protein [Oscillospiraceae bacterium]
MNIQIIQINEIKPAPYNPRKISDSQFAMLKESLTHLGFLIPVIVNQRNHIIIAGHQRTKAAKSLGITEIPAGFVDGVNDGDEIKFNQLH